MSKYVCRNSSIILGGVDVSDRISRWAVVARVNDLIVVELDYIDDGRLRFIEKDRVMRGGLRVARNGGERTIFIDDVNISSWVYSYERVVRIGELDIYRLHLHADREVLSINGMHPWEEPR